MYTTMYTMAIYSIGVQQQESWGLNNDSCRDTMFSKRNEHGDSNVRNKLSLKKLPRHEKGETGLLPDYVPCMHYIDAG